MDSDDFALLLWTTLEIESMLGSFLFRSLEAPSKTADTIYILGGCDALVCCFSLQRAEESRLLLNEVVGGMVMWFITLAESVVGIEVDHGVTLEGPVLRASPGSVEGGVLIIISAVGKVVRIEEELRISLPGQRLGKHNNHF